MNRVFIERIVIDSSTLGTQDPESFRKSVERELGLLLAVDGLPAGIAAAPRLDGGELPPASGGNMPRTVAELVVRSLGGNS